MGRAATHPLISRKGAGANQTKREGAIPDASVVVMERLPGAAERCVLVGRSPGKSCGGQALRWS